MQSFQRYVSIVSDPQTEALKQWLQVITSDYKSEIEMKNKI